MLTIALFAALLYPPADDYAPCAHAPGGPHPPTTIDDAALVETQIGVVVGEVDGSANLARYLLLVARRESSLRPGVIHQLPGDVAAARAAWTRHRRQLREVSEIADRPDLWLTYGLYGQISAYYGPHLPGGDPRRLCDTRDATIAYLARARIVLTKLARAKCIGAPRWLDLHRAMQRGDLCPTGRPDPFVAAARRVGLDPFARVLEADLGEEVELE